MYYVPTGRFEVLKTTQETNVNMTSMAYNVRRVARMSLD